MVNAAVKLSVEMQNLYLDGRDSPSSSRRSSVSSFASTLTELTDSDDEPCNTAISEIPERVPAASLSSNNVGVRHGVHEGTRVVSAPSDGELTHSARRMKQFCEQKRLLQRKKTRKEGKRVAASFDRAVTVPVEFHDLKPSLKPKFERRVYRHEDLEPLNIETVKWNGR